MEFHEGTESVTQLLPATKQLIQRIEQTTGRLIKIDTNHKLLKHARAVYAISQSDDKVDQINISPTEKGHIDHLVAHEIGHIRHLEEAPPNERTVPVISSRVRINAGRLLSKELEAMMRRGIPKMLVQPMMIQWTNNLVDGLVNTPSDIAIEQSLWSEEPDLHDAQATSLRGQIQTMQQILEPVHRPVTPPTVLRANLAMSYAYSKCIADMLEEPSLVEPFLDTPAETDGKHLLDIYSKHSPTTLSDFNKVSLDWANALGVQGLLEFRPVEEVRHHI